MALVRKTERATKIRLHLREEIALLGGNAEKHYKSFPDVERFVALFDPAVARHRRPMLAIIGATNLGKSMLAGDVLMKIATKLGLQSFLEVTVEDDGHLDLSSFDITFHAGVLLDGVGDALFLHSNRESLQGRAKENFGGKTTTMMYSYPYTLCRRAVVATFDLSADNLDFFTQHHWLSDKRNVIVLNLQELSWIEG